MRKLNRTYYFSVEGQTERCYLQWLQKTINASPDTKCTVKLNVKIEKNPVSYAKRLTNIGEVDVTHVFDYESSEPEHQKLFLRTLDQMKEVSKLRKSIKYHMGYSNFTFELWIILHKMDCKRSLDHRRQYLSLLNRAYETSFVSLDEFKREGNFDRILQSLTLDDVRKAIQRSEAIMSSNQARGCTLQMYKGYRYYMENPSLSLWKSIKAILSDNGLL